MNENLNNNLIENNKELSFRPQIHSRSKSLIRNEKIEDILYKDALRRREDKKKKLK